MTDGQPINVSEVLARKKRNRFHLTSAVLFLICCALAFWILPRFASIAEQTARETNAALPAMAVMMIHLASLFKVFWIFIALGLGLLNLLVWRGQFDSLLPLLQLAALLAGLAAVGLAFYAFYLPALTLISIRRH